jgi:hypothetical protein
MFFGSYSTKQMLLTINKFKSPKKFTNGELKLYLYGFRFKEIPPLFHLPYNLQITSLKNTNKLDIENIS